MNPNLQAGWQIFKQRLLDRCYTSKELVMGQVIRLFPLWIKPNHITSFRLVVLAPLLWWALATKQSCALIMIILATAFASDLLDGTMARQRQLISKSGAFLDALADKFVAVPAFVILAVPAIDRWLFRLILCREAIMVIFSLIRIKNYQNIKSNLVGQWYMTILAATMLVILLGAPAIITNTLASLAALVGIASLPYYRAHSQTHLK